MGKYWKLLGEYDAETTAYSALLGTISGAKSPYTPTEDARLVGLKVCESTVAVTTVLTGVQLKLTCSTFKPNSIEVGVVGTGLHTAPKGYMKVEEWVVDQPVKAGVPITIEGRCIGAYAAVTVEVFLWGEFVS
jgi:hypothetical protein